MFGKEATTRSDSRGSVGGETMLSIIAAGTRIVGDLESPGVVKVDGHIEGSIIGARQVLLGRDGAVHGNVQADEVVVGGSVQGMITATDRLELQGTAFVNGNIETKSIVVLEGARINGAVRMTDVSSATTVDDTGEALRIANG